MTAQRLLAAAWSEDLDATLTPLDATATATGLTIRARFPPRDRETSDRDAGQHRRPYRGSGGVEGSDPMPESHRRRGLPRRPPGPPARG